MLLETGHINVFKIHEFIALNPQIPSNNVGNFTEYTELVNKVIKDIPNNTGGWYLWGKINDIGLWETIYLGKASYLDHASLHTRIKDELIKERVAFWAYIFGKEPIFNQHQVLYNGKFDTNAKRSLRKTATQFIIWVSPSEITNEKILDEEKTLITLYRPSSNIQRVHYPAHTHNIDSIVTAIESEIRSIKS